MTINMLAVDVKTTNKMVTNMGIRCYCSMDSQPISHIAAADWHYPSAPIRFHDHKEGDPEIESDVLLADPELAKPPMYAVVMYNDNYTPMEFVVEILQVEFRHTLEQAVEIMLNIHHSGKGIAGIYPKDIAETKAKKVNNTAQKEGYPLLTQIEPHLSS
ncbi:ATP-dependent Clp protease adaptor ClpS [Psychrobacter sp. I-STPA10]|uniref:ATP-dependent Clp protease adaptor ClpS n=1 Tax=Psychrobacter sp. I-STPA10 TaxID=2585769 RepID=UPI001E2D8BB7|nr:ATP-dependent Clp protease adaptor ClpS [Psychrobacter sp. I-STPA10]